MASSQGGNHKLTLASISSQLMPQGKPNFLEVINYPMIAQLKQQIEPVTLLTYVAALVQDFCSSFNVSRNMNEAQIIEAASMLLDECGNFRLEDYTMMFALAKRGALVKVYERVDLSVITEMLDAYWEQRHQASRQAQESESNLLEGLGPTTRAMDGKGQQEAKMLGMFDGFGSGLSTLKNALKDKIDGGPGTVDTGTV